MARRKSRVYIELGVQGPESNPSSKSHELSRIESSRLVHESIRSYPDFKFNVRKALRAYEGSRGLELGLRQQQTIRSGKCLWGLCFHVGQRLTPRLTVAAGGLLPTSWLPT
ncbi:hypothetical protein PIB30_011302 [Stylosanthes scabra]|uniref:Uncharacterized protein n=1 Tax=Stylosanthes scabra TaxID=79078 RepID=A0ABU6V828_9FABA|nr:hypothetical protein [Stylosanthes scabra]